jgi:nucleoside-diphosphate-sugar epimerase
LTAAGHEVAGLTRSPAKADVLRRIGATPVIADALDPAAVMDVVQREKPEVVVHELTSIKPFDMRKFDQGLTETNRLRTLGTDNLLAAARGAGVRRFIAQSFASWPYARAGGPIKTEEDPLDSEPPAAFRRTLEAIRYLESAVTRKTGLEGVVLRCGAFYGPGTAIGRDGWMVNDIRKRRVPVIGGGGGVWSFTHVDDAARFTRAAIERGAPGSIISSMTILPACRNGCPPWRRRSAPNRHAGSRPGSPVS